MILNKLHDQINYKKSFLCIGLDIDKDKIPKSLLKFDDPIFEFAKRIIDSTNQYAIAYKPNIAFFEAYGADGFKSLKKIVNYLNQCYPEVFTIADAKRGDLGNTSKMYNGSNDFQELDIDDKNKLYQKVIEISKTWKNSSRIMYVVGAKNTKEILKIRRMVPNSYLLIPGVGAQGGNMTEICKYGLDKNLKLIINSTRSIIYASANDDFAQSAAYEAKKIQVEMEKNINALKL